MDFLAENNAFGQNILRLVSRANATIAELLRLSSAVPSVFKVSPDSKQNPYADILLDFSYFKASDQHETRIDANPQLLEKDDEFRDNHIDMISRIYLAFESVHRYVIDLNRLIEDLADGVYIQQSLESVMLNTEGRQLLAEALYVCGVLLMIIDKKFEGLVRERILVSYYRYSAQRSSLDSNVDDVCKLLRSTGYSPGKRPPNYPDEYFKRANISQEYIDQVIGRLRSDDIYNQVSHYPAPEHRSTALANQAAMLFVCLYFSPDILHTQPARMREIVDKYFSDNWVISVYMGMTENLFDVWEPYKAARQALITALDFKTVHEMADKHHAQVTKLIPKVHELLQEGVLTEECVLDNVANLLNAVRSCNVKLRWTLLHTASLSADSNTKRCRQMRDAACAKYEPLNVFQLLLHTGQLELKLKEMFRELLDGKGEKWSNMKRECVERLTELSEVYSGSQPLSRVEKNEKLRDWFAEMSRQVGALDAADCSAPATARKIVQLIEAIDQVQQYHQLESNLQVKQFLLDTRTFLHSMLRIINIKEQVLISLETIGDLSYAWEIIDSHTTHMQRGIRDNPTMVIRLRATFLKLASALDLPLLRINQANSPDLESVSQYYSNELVNYIRRVLHIIPEMLFSMLAQIIDLQTNSIKEVPTRLMKDQLKSYAQLEERNQVAKLTHDIALFTEGMLMMKRTLVGIVQIDPHRLLEEGIRKELVIRVSQALHNGLSFSGRSRSSTELIEKLNALGQIMDGYYRSFEYIQDYVGIYGLKIWQQEMSRIVNYNVEQECNQFLRQKIFDWKSIYQSKTIPIPKYPPLDGTSTNFIGRLAVEILRVTDPRQTIYVPQRCGWFDAKSQTETVSSNFFSLIQKSIGTAGLTGLDRLFSFMIVRDLQLIVATLDKSMVKDKSWEETLKQLDASIEACKGVVPSPTRAYSPSLLKLQRGWNVMADAVVRVGQMCLLRKHIATELNKTIRFDSKHLASALKTMNDAFLAEMKAHYQTPEAKPAPKADNFVFMDLATYLQSAGIYDPFSEIYIMTQFIPYMPLFMSVFVMSQLSRMTYTKALSGLAPKRGDAGIDGLPLVLGVFTFFGQFHRDNLVHFVRYLAVFIRSALESAVVVNVAKTETIGAEMHFNVLTFLDAAVTEQVLSRKLVTNHIPAYIFDDFMSRAASASSS